MPPCYSLANRLTLYATAVALITLLLARRGLLVSGMVDTARGAVLNLLDDIDRFG